VRAAAAAAAAQLLAQRLNDTTKFPGAARGQPDRFHGLPQDAASRAPHKQLPTLWLERKAKEQQFKQVGIRNGAVLQAAPHLYSCLRADLGYGLSHPTFRCCALKSICMCLLWPAVVNTSDVTPSRHPPCRWLTHWATRHL